MDVSAIALKPVANAKGVIANPRAVVTILIAEDFLLIIDLKLVEEVIPPMH